MSVVLTDRGAKGMLKYLFETGNASDDPMKPRYVTPRKKPLYPNG